MSQRSPREELVTQLPKIQKVWPLLKEGKIGALMRNTLLPRTFYFIEEIKKLRAVLRTIIFTQSMLQPENRG